VEHRLERPNQRMQPTAYRAAFQGLMAVDVNSW
jgi:hypothetical protein